MIPANKHSEHDSPRSDGKKTDPTNKTYTFIQTNTQAADNSKGREDADIDEHGQKTFYTQARNSF